MTSLYNQCFVVLKHGIFITYPNNYDTLILQRLLSGEIGERKMRVANPSRNCLLLK